MFVAKQIRKAFRDAPWASEAEVDAFVQEVGPQSTAELLKLLDVLVDDDVSGTGTQQRYRVRAFQALAEMTLDPTLFSPFAKALPVAGSAARAMLANLLPKLSNTAAHADLCEVLGVPESDARRAAAYVLGQVGGVQALHALQKLVTKKDFHGRMEAMEALVPKAGHRSVPLLGAVIEAGTSEEKRRALLWLGDRKRMAQDPTAVDHVRHALGDRDERVACTAIDVLACLVSELQFTEQMLSGGFIDSQSTQVIRAVMLGLRRYKSSAAVEFMVRRLRVGPNPIRMVALEALEAMGSDAAVPPLVEALKSSHVPVRNRASQALLKMATEGQVDMARTIIWLLRSRDVTVRRLAVEIAKQVGDPNGELSPKLLRCLRDEDWWVRERVADALVEMGSPNLTQHVKAYLDDPSDVVRRYAVGFLKRLRDPLALAALVRCLQRDSDWWVREWALDAIAEMKDVRVLPYVLQVMERDADIRPACFSALVTLGATEAVPQVIPYLSDPDAEVRLAAIKCVTQLSGPAAAAQVHPLRNDPDPRVREHCRETLTTWKMWRKAGSHIATMTQFDRMLADIVERGADDLILAAGRAPVVKHRGKIEPLTETALTVEQVTEYITPLLSPRQVLSLKELHDVDFSHEVKTHGLRFRAHVFQQMTGISAVFRAVKSEVPELESLGLPPGVVGFANFKNGLVLVGGPTGSGKSTTLAAFINYINRTQARHIVTLEDPIEVVHTRKESLINQREIGSHTKSFERGLRATLRQDPDVILVGELRDHSTVSMAVTAAETGHLVFGTVHTVSADASVDRIINAFPAAQQPQVRSMLAETLRAVVCQHLLRTRDGTGRVLAAEVMINNDAVSNLIRKGKAFQIPSVIATGKEFGMQSMDAELVRLVRLGVVTSEDAYAKANDKKAFEAALGREKSDESLALAPAPAPRRVSRRPPSGVRQAMTVPPPVPRQGRDE